MISAPLLEVVAVPRLRRAARRATGERVSRARAAAACSTRRAAISICGRSRRSPSRRSISTRRCTPTRATSRSRRRCSARRSATTCCGGSCALGPAIASIDLGCGSGRTLAWNADTRRVADRHRHQPVLRARGGRPAAICCSAICGGCRSRDGAFTKAWSLDVLEHLSPQALARHARRGQPRARRRRRAVRLHARAQERLARPAACGSSTGFARLCERLGLLDLRQERLRKSDHLNPLADHDDLRARRRRARLPIERDHVLHADHRRVRRERARRAWPSAWLAEARGARRSRRAPAPSDAVRSRARAGAGARRAAAARPIARSCALSALMKLDVLLFGRVQSGPFFALLRKTDRRRPSPDLERRRTRRPDAHSSTPRSIRPCPARSAARCTCRRSPRAWRRSATTCTSPRSRGGALAGRPRSHWHAMAPPLGRPPLRWLRAGAVTRAGARASAPTSSWSATTTSAARACSRRTALGVPAVLEVNAPIVDYPGSTKARARSRAARRADAALARSALPA